MSRRLTRRQALAASAASLGYLYTAPAFAAEKIAGANEKLTVAGQIAAQREEAMAHPFGGPPRPDKDAAEPATAD